MSLTVSHSRRSVRAIVLATAAVAGLGAVDGAYGATFIKADNANDLNLTTAWVGGVAPGAADVAQWDSTVSGANTTLLGASLSWLGLKILNPGGLVTINTGNALTIGSAGID